jgi:hypothetical protein
MFFRQASLAMLIGIWVLTHANAFANCVQKDGKWQDQNSVPCTPPQSPTGPATIQAQTIEPGLLERNLWQTSFHQAAHATEEIQVKVTNQADKNGVTVQELEAIRNAQRHLGGIGVAADIAAGAGVAVYAYTAFGMEKPTADKKETEPQSAAKDLEKLSSLQEKGAYALMGSGAVDLAAGAYAITVLKGDLKDIKERGIANGNQISGIDEAIEANQKAAENALYYGAGKGALGYLVLTQAQSNKKNADALKSALPTDAAAAETATPGGIDPSTQAPNFTPLYSNGVASAPVIGVNDGSASNGGSGFSVAQTEEAQPVVVAKVSESAPIDPAKGSGFFDDPFFKDFVADANSRK